MNDDESILGIIKEHFVLYLILAASMLVAVFFSPFAFLILPFVYFLVVNDRYSEVLIILSFILVLSDSLEPGLVWAKTFKSVLVLTLGLIYFLKKNEFAHRANIFRYFIPFVIVAGICLIFSPYLVTALQKTISYVLILLIIPNFVLEAYRARGRMFFKQFLTYALVLLVVSYLYKFVDPEIIVSAEHDFRLRGIFGNPNGLGLFLIVLVGLLVAMRNIFDGLISNREYVVILVIIVFMAISSGSRTALMSILALVFSLPLFRFSPWLGVFVFIITAVSYNSVFNVMVNVAVDFGLQQELRLHNIEEGSGRFIAWAFAWEEIQKSFVFGKGFGYDVELMRANFDWLSKAGHEGGVHNTYLILWLNTGLIGLILFFRGFFLLFIKAAKNTYVALPIMLSVLISITFEPWLSASLNPYTSIFLMTLTLLTVPVFFKGKAEIDEIETKETAE